MNELNSVESVAKRIVWRLQRKHTFNETDYVNWCSEHQEEATYLGDYTDILKLLTKHAVRNPTIRKSKELLEQALKAYGQTADYIDGDEEEDGEFI